MDQRVQYSTAEVRDGKLVIIKTITIEPARCPHYIMVGDHWRDDGSCKCNDPEHRAMMIRDWGYSTGDFKE